MKAIILFAHGSRDPAWFAPFEQLRSRVLAAQSTQSPAPMVQLAYLEFATPSLPDAIAAAVLAGATALRVVPVFLAAGAHVRHDLPLLIQAAERAHPALQIELTPPVGEQALVLDAIAQVCGH